MMPVTDEPVRHGVGIKNSRTRSQDPVNTRERIGEEQDGRDREKGQRVQIGSTLGVIPSPADERIGD